jgi:hypothetical protein
MFLRHLPPNTLLQVPTLLPNVLIYMKISTYLQHFLIRVVSYFKSYENKIQSLVTCQLLPLID